MYKTILVPLDGSTRAETILPHVEQLAHRFEATVIFLLVIEPSNLVSTTHGTHLDLWLDEIRWRTEKAESYLATLQGEFREKGITAQVRVGKGAIIENIINTAELEGADLIAMASHGHTGLARVFYGSITAGILQRVNRPLLLVRA